MIEFALILPLLLMLLVGGFFVNSAMLVQQKLQSVAYESAVAGAQHPGNGADDCNVAEATANRMVSSPLSRFDCSETGQQIDVELGYDMPIAIPFLEVTRWQINVVGSAVLRA